MAGGGGGGTFDRRTPEELRNLVRNAEERTTMAAFEAQLSHILGQLLGNYNSRNAQLVTERLDALKGALEGTIEGALDQLFGGSVAKHTYVDGLSDIDSLLLINQTELEGLRPSTVLNRIENTIRATEGEHCDVASGRMAVTVEFDDGMKIQLLPAVRMSKEMFRVPSSQRDDWANINPQAFQAALTKRNAECGGKLVPMIKLAKAIIGELPESQRLSGYHTESIAISLFRDFRGQKTVAAMLPAFFEGAQEVVRSPIRDNTGQSVHVDEYLGPENSQTRLAVSHVLGRIAKRMRNASAAGSATQWQSLFGVEE